MNVPDTYSELQDAINYMESHDLSDDPQCQRLREILAAADKLFSTTNEDTVDAAMQATREQYGEDASLADYLGFLVDRWSHYDDVEDYAVAVVEFMDEKIPAFVSYHVNWDAVGRELLDDEAGPYVFAETGLYIFDG